MALTLKECERSGLMLCAAAGATVTRIAKRSYGALNPPRRPMSGERRHWGRFDVPGHRTAYAGSPRDSAYAESLANQRPSLADRTLGSFFADDSSSDRPLLEAIADEWGRQHQHRPGAVAASWRTERSEYTLALPNDGWFVEITHSASVQTIRTELATLLHRFGESEFSMSTLTNENRELTTSIAAWVHGQTLFDGSRPHGIKYGSKHGLDFSCWAVWLRKLDDGQPVDSEPIRVLQEWPITRDSPALRRVGKRFGLTFW